MSLLMITVAVALNLNQQAEAECGNIVVCRGVTYDNKRPSLMSKFAEIL